MSSESGAAAQKSTGKVGQKKGVRKGEDVNLALRRAYKSAVDESIPQSMLDLLGKLS